MVVKNKKTEHCLFIPCSVILVVYGAEGGSRTRTGY